MNREQDSLLASFQPYYLLDKQVEKDAIAKLKENYHTHLKGILPSVDYLRYIERTLKEIYGEGIVSTENIQELHKDSTSAIMIIDDKLANSNLPIIYIRSKKLMSTCFPQIRPTSTVRF